MKSIALIPKVLAGLSLAALLLIGQPPALAQPVTMCSVGQLSLTVDDGNGRFDGMSHSGVELIVTNHGQNTCALPARPTLDFENSRYESLHVSELPIPGMRRTGPGPVLHPVEVAPNNSVVADVHWASGDVYDHGKCLDSAYVAARIGDGFIRAAFKGHLCGSLPAGPTYQTTLYKPSVSTAVAIPSSAPKELQLQSPVPGVLCDQYFCADDKGVSQGLTSQYLGQATASKLASQGAFNTSSFTFSNGIFCDVGERLCRKDRYYGPDGKRSGEVSEEVTKRLFGS